MPRVPRPDEMPRAALDPAHQPAQINIGVASRIGESGRAMGNAIKSIGDAFGEVVGRVGQAQDANNYANAQLEWLKGDAAIQDDIKANVGEDGVLWQETPQRYDDLNKSIGDKHPISDEAKRNSFEMWKEKNTWERGRGAALQYQGAQRNQFVKSFDGDLSGLEDRLQRGEVDPGSFTQYYDALSTKLDGMNRTVMSETEVQARKNELQARLVGSLDRHLADKDPAERSRFWDEVRKGRFEIDQPRGNGSIMLPDGKEGPSGIPAAPPGTPGVVSAITHQPYRTFNSQGYGERTTGAITVNGRTYEFVNGGSGRGSIPLGEYGIKRFTSGTQRASEGFQYRKDAFELTDVRDDAPGTKGQAPRQGLLIHDGNSGVTAGCIGIKGDFQQFKTDLQAEMQKNGGKFPKLQLGAPSHGSGAKQQTSDGGSQSFMSRVAQIESSGDPTKRTGSYAGLFQLSEADFRKYGGKGSITDAEQNTIAATAKFKDLAQKFEAKTGRAPNDGELYLMHQQGEGGAIAHISNPDQPAWQSMAGTAEGRSKGEAWAKQAIWGNLTPEAKKQFGSVENVTSKQFVEFWSKKVGGGTQQANAAGGPTTISLKGLTDEQKTAKLEEAAKAGHRQFTYLLDDDERVIAKPGDKFSWAPAGAFQGRSADVSKPEEFAGPKWATSVINKLQRGEITAAPAANDNMGGDGTDPLGDARAALEGADPETPIGEAVSPEQLQALQSRIPALAKADEATAGQVLDWSKAIRPSIVDRAIPAGRLAPGQTFTINTARGPITVPSEWINALPQKAREQMARRAGEDARVWERGRQAVANGMMESAEVNMALHGKPGDGYDVETVKAAYGKAPETLRKHAQRMQVAQTAWNETRDLADIPSEDVAYRIEDLERAYLSQGAVDATTKKIMDSVRTKATQLLKQREQDPAGSVEGSKEVRSVREKLIGGAVRNKLDATALMDARMQAQIRIDVPEHQRSPLSRREITALAPSLRGLSDGDAMASIEKLHEKVKTTYGEKYAKLIVDRTIETAVRNKDQRETYLALMQEVSERGKPSAATTGKAKEQGRSMWQGLHDMLPSKETVGKVLSGADLGLSDIQMDQSKPQAFPSPTRAAVDHLKKNPNLIDDFDKKFGPGAGDKAVPNLRRMLMMNQ